MNNKVPNKEDLPDLILSIYKETQKLKLGTQKERDDYIIEVFNRRKLTEKIKYK